jgi:hypothetical protein
VGSKLNSVQQRDSGIITTADAIKTVIEDPLLPILEKDPNKTQSAWQIRGPCLNDNPTSPGFELFMKNLVPYLKISMFLDLGSLFRGLLSPLLG